MNDGIRRRAAQVVMFPAMLPLPPSCIPVADAVDDGAITFGRSVVETGSRMYADTVFAMAVVGDHAGEPATANGEAVA